MVGLAVYLPNWPTDLVRRWRRLDAGTPVVLSRCVHQAEVVASACDRAGRRGVRVGMSLAHARALLPDGPRCVEPIDDWRGARALRRLGARVTRWLPVVSIDGVDGLLCDATGCDLLYRGTDRLVRTIAGNIRRWGVCVRVAAAPTFGAAWALARFGPAPEIVVEPARLCEALAGLPLAGLRLDAGILFEMKRVGLERIAHLLPIPRHALADRYGPLVLLRLDQAMGRAFEVVTPMRAAEPVVAEREFDGPTDRPEVVALASRGLLARLCDALHRRESGCRLLEVRLVRADLSPLTLTVRTARPTRDVRHLWSLLAGKLEGAHLGFGVCGVRLRAGALAGLPHQQAGHWTPDAAPEAGPDEAAIARLVDTLNARLGVGSVRELRPRESHIPEAAFAMDPVVELRGGGPAPELSRLDRPSLLYDLPRRIDVTFLSPDGPIALVRHAGQSHRVACGTGPERIEPEWWRRHAFHDAAFHDARDYFQIKIEDGRVLWVFRAGGAWFLHGLWA